MTTTAAQAYEAMLAHHRALTEGVATRVAALTGVVSEGGRYEPAVAELLGFLTEEVLPHALAEEETIYHAARAAGDLTAAVKEMTIEHRRLEALSEALANASSGQAAAEVARAAGSLFTAHVDRENKAILPRLQAAGADLAGLLATMHARFEAAKRGGSTSGQVPGAEGALLDVVLEAAGALASHGEGDRACRLVASAWAALRRPRPDLAVRATAGLHKLARSLAAEPVRFRTGSSGTSDHVLDVREMAPAKRHEVIFATYRTLAPGGGFVLANDHDPKPLYYQFEAEHAGQFTWEYLEAGPVVWRVRIGRTGPNGGAPEPAA